MHLDLHAIWFGLLGVLLAGYGILDGFDLGVGIVYLFTKEDIERRTFMHAIGPIWDGNEVWLVTFGGAFFAGFPVAYAAALSGLYLPLMALLCALIFRGVSLEFRNKHTWPAWKTFWDISFGVSSALIAFLFGVAVGASVAGLPVQKDLDVIVTLHHVFRPYPILIGLTSVALCAMHGTIYLYLKTTGDLQQKLHGWMWTTFGIFLVFYMMASMSTVHFYPSSTANFHDHPWVWGIAVLNVLAVANIPRAIHMNRPGYAFLSSCCTMAALLFLFGVALFPNLLRSTLNPDWSLTVYNSASSETTLGIMLIVACIGMPFVLTYTAIAYWVFRGKVQIDEIMY